MFVLDRVLVTPTPPGDAVPRVPHREPGFERDSVRDERVPPAAGAQLREDVADLPDQACQAERSALPFHRNEGERGPERERERARLLGREKNRQTGEGQGEEEEGQRKSVSVVEKGWLFVCRTRCSEMQ